MGAGSCLHLCPSSLHLCASPLRLCPSPMHVSLTKAFTGSSEGHVGRQQLLWLLHRSRGHLGVALGFPWLDPRQLSSVWIMRHVKAVKSALSGAQPSKQAAPRPRNDRKHRSSCPPSSAGVCAPQGLTENGFHALQKCCNCRQSVQPVRNSRSEKYLQRLPPATRAKVCQGCTGTAAASVLGCVLAWL